MRALLFAALLLLQIIPAQTQDRSDLLLWYNEPSGDVWEKALPIGNGKLGAMVYGNVAREKIQLNEHTVWSGGPNRNDNPLAQGSLEKIRSLIFDNKHKEAEELANKTIISQTSHGQMFQPVGSLELSFVGHEQFTNYYRDLDIQKAVAKTTYRVGDVTYTREILASLVHGVVVMRISANVAGKLSFTTSFSTPQPQAVITTSGADELSLTGVTTSHEGVEGRVRFRAIASLKTTGGSVSSTDTTLIVHGADAATIYISIGTNFNNYKDLSGDENARARALLDRALPRSYEEISSAHTKKYREYFDRVRINLGRSDKAKLPTNERLKAFRSNVDPQFVALYFQFGRYLLISSSQPGGQPANLQGIWNHHMKPPWDSKYTININAQMNYWPAEKTNLAELHEPFLKMVRELSETGKETARVMYGSRGWMAHHNTDIWRATGAVDAAFWGCWNGGGGWTSQHLWEHYLYSGDTTFLSSIYPVLREAAKFYVDFLVVHPSKRWLVVNPGMSPENSPKSHGGASIDAGTTMDNQIVFDVFQTAIQAARILNVDSEFSDTLKRMVTKLPPMHIGRHVQLQEWLEDLDDPKDDHRHISHLYGLFPSNQISPYHTPELYVAARNTLMQRGDISTGWSMGWKVNWWAKLLDGNRALELIKSQLTPVGINSAGGGTYDNLLDAHPPFQIDGNFGCTSGIAEMLMQISDGAIHLLPALPNEWPTGSISGLRARGGFEIIEMHWNEKKLTKVVIKSLLGGNLRLRTHDAIKTSTKSSLKTAAGKNPNLFYQVNEVAQPIISPGIKVNKPVLSRVFTYDLPTTPGEVLTILAK